MGGRCKAKKVISSTNNVRSRDVNLNLYLGLYYLGEQIIGLSMHIAMDYIYMIILIKYI